MDIVFLIGRILFAVAFVTSGLMTHLVGRKQGTEFARSYNAPAPELLVPLAGVAIVAGGLMIALGIWADLGALLIIAFLIGITPIMHAFWKEQDPQMQQNQMAHFVKNATMLGAAIIIFWLYNQGQDLDLSITDALFDRID